MKVFYINLDRSEDRRNLMESKFPNEDLIRISGIDGIEWALDGEFDSNGFPIWDEDFRHDFIKGNQLFKDSILPPTHVACNFSHRKAIEAFLKTEDKWAIILEDDVEPNGKLLNGGKIEDYLNVPNDADMFYLCGTRPDRRINLDNNGQIKKVRTLMGYCLSRKAAELFLGKTIPMMWLSDFQFPVCCFDSMSFMDSNGKVRDRKPIVKHKTLVAESIDKNGKNIRREKNIDYISMPPKDKKTGIGLVLPEIIKSDVKIKAFADNGIGLIKHSYLSKESLLGHVGEFGTMMAEGRVIRTRSFK